MILLNLHLYSVKYLNLRFSRQTVRLRVNAAACFQLMQSPAGVSNTCEVFELTNFGVGARLHVRHEARSVYSISTCARN